MAAAEAFVAKHELSPKPLSFWVEQEAFLQNQLKEKTAGRAINFLMKKPEINVNFMN
jgi:hypothetical protein